MSWVRFSVAVLLTSAALVIAVFATGTFLVGNVLASSIPAVAQMHAPGNGNVPPELAGLKDIPAGERFAHFKGAQLNLTDKDGKPIQVTVTPGVANNVTATSLTITGNDGASHTYSLNDQTMTRGQSVSSGENVVVLTLDNASTARAVFDVNPGSWHHP
jgi:hypothetical protein